MAKPTPAVLRKAIEQPEPMQVDFAKREITGYGAVFGNVDNHGDIIAPGAFKKTISDRLPRNLLKFFLCHEDNFKFPAQVQLRNSAEIFGAAEWFCRRTLMGLKKVAAVDAAVDFDDAAVEFCNRGLHRTVQTLTCKTSVLLHQNILTEGYFFGIFGVGFGHWFFRFFSV